MGAKTVQELIDLLQKVKDKDQVIHVWSRYGYYGSNLNIQIERDQDAKPLMIESNDW